MQCRYCGSESDTRYCPMCGHKMPQPKPPTDSIDTAGTIKQYEPILTVKEACSLLRCSRSMIYELIRQERIPCFRLGSHIRFRTETLLTWAGQQEQITTKCGDR